MSPLKYASDGRWGAVLTEGGCCHDVAVLSAALPAAHELCLSIRLHSVRHPYPSCLLLRGIEHLGRSKRTAPRCVHMPHVATSEPDCCSVVMFRCLLFEKSLGHPPGATSSSKNEEPPSSTVAKGVAAAWPMLAWLADRLKGIAAAASPSRLAATETGSADGGTVSLAPPAKLMSQPAFLPHQSMPCQSHMKTHYDPTQAQVQQDHEVWEDCT